MTNITIQNDGRIYRLTAAGHATGKPEACAAVSGIVYALGGYLKNLERAGSVTLDAFRLASGAAELAASGPAAEHPFGMAAVGLMQIAARYPEQVRVDAGNFFEIPGGKIAPVW